MWVSNALNNFAPFAGFMLMGYVKRGRAENGGQELHPTASLTSTDVQGGNDADDAE
jgi:hypothetical protein